ncbi:MAG: hypothetical protein GKS06_07550 [Acidobacteria bacterium]|nr:hypothetical protein [Acidobacteriota bacterium]
MYEAASRLNERLAPAEQILFPWLTRVVIAASLMACAWLDDAPPLDIAAFLIGVYVAVRVATQIPVLVEAAPFENRLLSLGFAVGSVGALGLSFLAVVTFVERLALSVA